MDNQRLIVWAAFGLLAFMTYQTWMLDYAQPPAEATQTLNSDAPATTLQPEDPAGSLPSLPEADSDTPVLQPQAAPGEAAVAPDASDASQAIHVSTDVFDIEISTAGGVIKRAVLRNYPVAKDRPDTLIELLTPQESRYAQLHSGLIADAGEGETYFNASLTAAATLLV